MFLFFFKQKTAYEMRISDWSSDVCSSDLVKESGAAEMPFFRMKVRLKREIVTMGVPGIDPARDAGAYVDPEDWNALIGAPDVVVIDTRHDSEVDIGTFSGAINPKDRKRVVSGTRVSVRIDLGGRRLTKT